MLSKTKVAENFVLTWPGIQIFSPRLCARYGITSGGSIEEFGARTPPKLPVPSSVTDGERGCAVFVFSVFQKILGVFSVDFSC